MCTVFVVVACAQLVLPGGGRISSARSERASSFPLQLLADHFPLPMSRLSHLGKREEIKKGEKVKMIAFPSFLFFTRV